MFYLILHHVTSSVPALLPSLLWAPGRVALGFGPVPPAQLVDSVDSCDESEISKKSHPRVP